MRKRKWKDAFNDCNNWIFKDTFGRCCRRLFFFSIIVGNTIIWDVEDFFFSFQVMIPLSLYVTIEMTKLLQVYHIHNNSKLFDSETNKRIECRALNITEELGQVSFYDIKTIWLPGYANCIKLPLAMNHFWLILIIIKFVHIGIYRRYKL